MSALEEIALTATLIDKEGSFHIKAVCGNEIVMSREAIEELYLLSVKGKGIKPFPTDVLGNPMREYDPGKWESARWTSSDKNLQLADEIVKVFRPVLDAARPLILNGERLRDFARQ